jgi:hypothetical protein
VAAAGDTGIVIYGAPISQVVAIGSVGSIGMGPRTVALTSVTATGIAGSPGVFYWTTIDDSEIPNWQNVSMNV